MQINGFIKITRTNLRFCPIVTKPGTQCKLLLDLTRTNTTNNEAMLILTPVLKHFGIAQSEVSASTATFRRNRKIRRKKLTFEIKENFEPPDRATVHYDEKIMPDLSGQFGERLAIVLSGNTKECRQGKLLSGKLIKNGTGETQAKEVVKTLEEWKCLKNVYCACFDTTSSNTGYLTGR